MAIKTTVRINFPELTSNEKQKQIFPFFYDFFCYTNCNDGALSSEGKPEKPVKSLSYKYLQTHTYTRSSTPNFICIEK